MRSALSTSLKRRLRRSWRPRAPCAPGVPMWTLALPTLATWAMTWFLNAGLESMMNWLGNPYSDAHESTALATTSAFSDVARKPWLKFEKESVRRSTRRTPSAASPPWMKSQLTASLRCLPRGGVPYVTRVADAFDAMQGAHSETNRATSASRVGHHTYGVRRASVGATPGWPAEPLCATARSFRRIPSASGTYTRSSRP